MEMVACLWGEGGISRIAYLAEKSVLGEKGRVVNQKNLDELRVFSTPPLALCSLATEILYAD